MSATTLEHLVLTSEPLLLSPFYHKVSKGTVDMEVGRELQLPLLGLGSKEILIVNERGPKAHVKQF